MVTDRASQYVLATENVEAMKRWDGPTRDRKLRDENVKQAERWLKERVSWSE